MRKLSRRIGWIIIWGAALLGEKSLWGQPMPWPSDLTPKEPIPPAASEKPSPPGSSSESASSPPTPTPGKDSPAGTAVQELKPSLYYLKDKQGNLQPVPGFTLEDFRELYELKHLLEQKAQPPGYSVPSLEAQGIVRGNYVELTLDVRVTVRESTARIPLWLEGMTIRKFEGEALPGATKGEYLLHWEEGEGYVAWISGQAGSSHRLRIEGAVPIQQVGEQRRLRFRCLRATTSQMRLRTPGEGLKVEVSDPATLVEVIPASEGQTELKLEGLGGNVDLVWRPSGQTKQEAARVLEVTGETIASLEREKITGLTNLVIKVLGPPCDEVEIRLPEGAKLNPSPTSEAALTVEKDQRIKVHFLQKALEHRVRLEWEQSREKPTEDSWVELGGLEVIGAVKHRGYVAIWGPGDWHVLWRGSASVRQTEQLPPTLLAEGLLAGFEYTSQPYSLRVRLAVQQVRVSVEPEYRLWVSAREVKLEGLLKYTIRGGKVEGFRVGMPGWEVDQVGPEEMVVEGAVRMEGDVLEIPLKQPAGGHVELTIVARRSIPPGTKQLAAPLPQDWQVEWPMGSTISVLPASIVIIPEENVELAPEEKQMAGWVRQLAINFTGLPKRQQPILAYRAESGGGTFTAGFRVHERQIQVEGTAQIHVEEDGVQVDEKLSYTISYEVVGTLMVWMPAAVRSESVQFQVDGQVVPAVPVSSSPQASEDPGPVQMAIPLPQGRIGLCDLTIRYRIAGEKILPHQSQLRTVPLILPVEGKWMGWRVGITGVEGMEIKLRGEQWKSLENLPEPGNNEGRLVIGCTEPTPEVLLGVYRRQGQPARPTVISRAFVQTWWTRLVREDRAVYRLVGGKKEWVVLLPEGANPGAVEVWVDGQPTAFQSTTDGRISIPLPAEKAGDIVVEIRYHFDQPSPPRGHLQVSFPRPEPEVWIDRFYWLCHLPRDEHLIINPPGFAPEYQWKWNGWSWGRTPRWTQTELETWTGALTWPMPPEGVNSYLFSSLGRIEMASVYTTGRSVLVLMASSIALGIGLLVVYVPGVRHPAWLILAGVGVGSAALLYPEQTVLIVQASLLGVVLAVVAGVLRVMIAGRQEGAARISDLELDQQSTQRQYPSPQPGSTTSTQPMPSPPGPSSISPNPVSY